MAAAVRSITTADRFWAKVDKADDCWLWAGYIKSNGYATFYPGGGRHVEKVYVHRWAYEADADNTYWHAGYRYCKSCRRERSRARLSIVRGV